MDFEEEITPEVCENNTDTVEASEATQTVAQVVASEERSVGYTAVQPTFEVVSEEPSEDMSSSDYLELMGKLESDDVLTEEDKEQSELQTKKFKRKKSPLVGGVLFYLHDVIYLMAIIMVVLLLILRVVVVSGPSMNDNFVDKDYVFLLSNLFYKNPKQGDVVVISKSTFDNGKPIIKRIIATEGQTVDIDFEAGIVYVDDVALVEDYTKTPTNMDEGVEFPLTVEPGCVFVMGDNRNHSKDSRNPEIGQVDCREILGKALFIIFPGYDAEHPRDFKRIGVVS